MSERNSRETKMDQVLDLLLDALSERQATRLRDQGPRIQRQGGPAAPPTATAKSAASRTTGAMRPQQFVRAKRKQRAPQPGEPGWVLPEKRQSIQLDKTLWRFIILVAALAVLVNIPVTTYGVSLARIMPDSASLIIRDGLLLKGEGDEIYMLEDDQLRWISSLDAFEHLGLRWENVHEVDDAFLATFQKGEPFHVLLKCYGSPHIYRIENQRKRWIEDIPTFEAEGHVWEDVRVVDCTYLRSIPDGPSIPEGAGPPPQP